MSKDKKLTKDEIIKIFYKLSFFNNFTLDEKTRLGEVESFICHYTPRSFIITQGDLESSLYVLLKGNVSEIILIVIANKIKFSILFSRKKLEFLKIKITNNNPIIDVIKSPTIPVSVKISK